MVKRVEIGQKSRKWVKKQKTGEKVKIGSEK